MWWMMMTALAGGSYEVHEGPRPPRDLHTAVHARKADFAKCFTGTEVVKMRVLVSPDGMVTDAKFSMTDVDQAVASCVARGVYKLRFSPSTDPGPTTYTWRASQASLDESLVKDRPEPGDLLVEGGLTKQQVKATMKRNMGHLSFCFRKATVANHDLTHATLDLHFGIDSNGSLVSAEGKHSDAGEDLAKCVADRIMAITFDKPNRDGITRVVYALEFSK